MDKLINVNLGFCFEIKDSEVYGGEGSVGYISIEINGVEKLEAINSEFVDGEIEYISNLLKVSKENVRLI